MKVNNNPFLVWPTVLQDRIVRSPALTQEQWDALIQEVKANSPSRKSLAKGQHQRPSRAE